MTGSMPSTTPARAQRPEPQAATDHLSQLRSADCRGADRQRPRPGAAPAQAATPSAVLPTENPANWTPNVLDGEVQSIWQVGNRVIIGGNFTQVANSTSNGGQVYNRSYIAAFNATTGLVDTNFNPVLSGVVNVIIPTGNGTSVYIGGDFNTVNGTNRRKIARINVANGSLVTAFNVGGANGLVRDLRLVNGNLYVAGLFTTLGGQPRTYIGSVNPTTGAVNTKLNLTLSGLKNGGIGKVIKMDITPDGDKLLIIGNFMSVGGQSRVQVAMLDLTTTPVTVSPWSTTFYTVQLRERLRLLPARPRLLPDGTYAVIVTTGAYGGTGRPATPIARFEIDRHRRPVTPTWSNLTGGDTSYSVEIHNGVVYVGGHMRWLNNPYSADRHGAGGVTRPAWLPSIRRPASRSTGTRRGPVASACTTTTSPSRASGPAATPTAGTTNCTRSWRSSPGPAGSTCPPGTPASCRTTSTSSAAPAARPAPIPLFSTGSTPAAAADLGRRRSRLAGRHEHDSSPYRNSGSSTSTAPADTLSTPSNDATVPRSDFDRPPREIFTTERYDPARTAEPERDAVELQRSRWYADPGSPLHGQPVHLDR